MLNTGYIPLNSITKGSQSSGRKTPAKPFPGHLWDCASWFNTSIWCVVFVLLDYKFLCSVAQVSWKRPVWDFWNQKVWLSTSLLKIISCNFIFTILEASIHFIGCLNGAVSNANTQAWMNKYAAHTWEVIFFFLTHVILSTVWFHWKILALELWKMQLWSLSKQKTMSTLLMTITKSWIQILNCYALDGRKQWPDTMSESSESAAEFFSQFPMAFLWVRDTG